MTLRIPLIATLVALLSVLVATTAQAAEEPIARVFDPVLSLTGSCTTSKIDSVPDPGCPEKHPAQPFEFPFGSAVTTDEYGDIFVSMWGQEGVGSRIDIFNSEGVFLTELPDPKGATSLAVDSEGNLYVCDDRQGEQYENGVFLHEPLEYEPQAGKVSYASVPDKVVGPHCNPNSIAVNRTNDHLFVDGGASVFEYASAKDGNALLDESIGMGALHEASTPLGLAVDAAHGRLYANGEHCVVNVGCFGEIVVLELEPPHHVIEVVDGSNTPLGYFKPFVAVTTDEGSGHFFIFDGEGSHKIYEFGLDGSYLGTLEFPYKYVYESQITVDNGKQSPNGALNPYGRYLFVPSHPTGLGHLFAFGVEPPVGPPLIVSTSVSDVSGTDAQLHAKINPENLPTHYLLEYTTRQSYETQGFTGATLAGEGEIPAGGLPVEVSAQAAGLVPGGEYRFRVVAENSEGSAAAERPVATYPPPPAQSCPNEALRTGASAQLPDCRAYELVTPANTNGRAPKGVDHLGTYFPTREASPAGNSLSFLIQGGVLPGSGSPGTWAGDPYLATRSPDGWSSAAAGPNAAESESPTPGSTSADQGYSFWMSGGGGSVAVEGFPRSDYLRYPDGHSALIGRGELATDPVADGKLISENGGHVLFTSRLQLEPGAPASGMTSIYDRTADEVTHVVSLLPGGLTPSSDAIYVGASLDGRGVAFEIGNKLYLRLDNEETYEAAENVTFAGVAEGGARLFYVKGGDLFAFDAEAEETLQFTESGDVTPVNVAADGAAAYFVSPSVLTGEEENPNGAKAQAGKENLYLSREGAISFVGRLEKLDVDNEVVANDAVRGLGFWTVAVEKWTLAIDPSRTNSDGSALLFESRANLTEYDSEGHVEVYLYNAAGTLQCVSCSPTGEAPAGEASLQSVSDGIVSPEPFSSFAFVGNLRADGHRAFFQSTEALAPGDTDGLQDVYEWEAQGVGSCDRPAGCVSLISSGRSARPNYLYATSDSGDDVFIRTTDLLAPWLDPDETASIYDVRVNGGFPQPPPPAGECLGEACQPAAAPPGDLTPASASFQGAGNVKPAARRCPKGKRRVRGKCVRRKHHHRSRSRQAPGHRRGAKGRAGR